MRFGDVSNAELKSKLSMMGKGLFTSLFIFFKFSLKRFRFLASRLKLAKLANTFTMKSKAKCKKVIEQTTITCNNLFSSVNAIDHRNNSYYTQNNYNDDDEDDVKQSKFSQTLKKGFKNPMKHFNNKPHREEFNRSVNEPGQRVISSNKCQKAYRSFRSVIKRNPSAPNSTINSKMYPYLNSKLLRFLFQ